jgi:threonine dehydratase
MITLADVIEANETIVGSVRRTPLIRFDVDTPCEIYLKLENLQQIGSFKIRGAANAMSHMSEELLRSGVLTASAGNMAQGVAWMAREKNIDCTIVVPETAPAAKIEAIERLGGSVISVPFDEWWQTFETRRFPGVNAAFVHAFDDPHVMAGNGTIALEIVEDLPDVDAVVIPWGGGGLACGIAAAMRELRPMCRIYAAEVDSAAPLGVSMAEGKPQIAVHTASFVDGIGSKTVFPQMLEIAMKLLDGAIAASLDEVASVMRLMAVRSRIVSEGAGAVAAACAIAGRAGHGRIACIVSGGNIDLDKFCTIMSRGKAPDQ